MQRSPPVLPYGAKHNVASSVWRHGQSSPLFAVRFAHSFSTHLPVSLLSSKNLLAVQIRTHFVSSCPTSAKQNGVPQGGVCVVDADLTEHVRETSVVHQPMPKMSGWQGLVHVPVEDTLERVQVVTQAPLRKVVLSLHLGKQDPYTNGEQEVEEHSDKDPQIFHSLFLLPALIGHAKFP